MDWNISLNGETALIVGGTRNIGLSIAEAINPGSQDQTQIFDFSIGTSF